MLTIALTGGIGSGKTSVCKIFHKIVNEKSSPISLKILDADHIARDLLSGSLSAENASLLTQIKQYFGSALFKDAHLDRAKLRQLIFSSDSKKEQLESLLHPLVYQEIFSRINQYLDKEQDENKTFIIIIAIPLLIETHSEKQFDRVLVVDSSIDLQIKRSVQRDQCSDSLIRQIIQSQVDRQTRLNSADDIIKNGEDFNHLEIQVRQLFQYYSFLALNPPCNKN